MFSLGILIWSYKKAKDIEKKQLFYLLLGLSISIFFGTLTNLIIPQIYPFIHSYYYGPLGVIFFVMFTALAITRYHLFGIEVILTEILVGVIGILLIIQIFTTSSALWRIVNGIIFVLFCVFGYLLIRGVFREIRRREEVEKIAQRERALREEAERLAQEFQRLDKVKNQFILTTQHHLRTPLSIIKGYLATILGGIYGEIKNQKINQALKNTLLATQRLITLVNEFLDISQFQIGKGALKKEEINLKDVLNEVVLELKPEAEKKKLYLKMIFKAKDLKLKADFQRLKEAFFNLIDNAIKYTQKGGVEIKVESKAPETLLVSIKDTGIGMSKETLSKIFKGLFERGKEAEAVEPTGKGIGLFISKTLIDAHGGKIWADSQGPCKGSTFFVELPKK
jgi:signal transduction histidine kinase